MLTDKDRAKNSTWRNAANVWKPLHAGKKVEGLQRALESLLKPLKPNLQVKIA
jgi:hypothetical protein